MQRIWFALAGSVAIVTTLGCGSSEAPPRPATSLRPAAPEPAPAAQPEQPEEPAVMVQKEAAVGVGKKGRDYEPGLITTPVQAYSTAKEEIAFNIQTPHAMQLYHAQHESYPKSHEEFMEKIIKPGAIQLPELPAGHRYVYDPEKAQLMVEHPE